VPKDEVGKAAGQELQPGHKQELAMKNVAVIVILVGALNSPALADDAQLSTVLRDTGAAIAQGVEANALSVPATSARPRSPRVRSSRSAQVIESSPPAIDLRLMGHN